jgi:hypothetical protein
MGEFLIDFKANGTTEFAKAAKETTQALDRQEASARRMTKWRNELAQLARQELTEAEKKLPLEKQMETLLQRRAQLEERIARAGNNQVRLTALRLQQARNNARISAVQGQQRDRIQDLLMNIPGAMAISNLVRMFGGLGRFLPTAAIGAATYALGKMISTAVRGAQAMTDLAGRARITRDELQGLSYAASATGTDLNVIIGVYEALAQMQGQVQAGIGRTSEKIKEFAKLGITFEDIKKKTPMQLFVQLNEILAKGTLSNEQYAAAVKLLGESVKDMVAPAKDGLADMVKEFETSHAKINDSTLDFLDKLGDAWDKFWAKGAASGKKFTTELAGGFLSTGALIAGGGLKLLKPILPGVAKFGDELLEMRATKNGGGDGEAAVDKAEVDHKNKTNNLDTAKKLEGLRNAIRKELGEDADDVLDELDGSNSKPEDYERALRRAKRQKSKETGGGNAGNPPSADALQRIGLFVGDPTGVRKEIQNQNVLLRDVKRELEKVNSNLTKE